MGTATITLTTSFQRLSTLMNAAGFNISDLIKKRLFILNSSASATVTVVFDADSALGESGTHLGAGASLTGRDINTGRVWIKSSGATDIDVSTEDITINAANRPFTGISDNGTTTTVSQPLVVSKAITETPVALTSATTIALDASLGNFFWYVSGHTTTLNVTNLAAGQTIKIRIISDGTSRTQTFGTGVTSTGTLATGTDATKAFDVWFSRNGGSTKGIEVLRTAALAF
jgi:hypothetical protein